MIPSGIAHQLSMKPITPVPGSLLQLAQIQSHAITRDQALRHGLSNPVINRLLHNGSWQVPVPGVYVTHSGPVDWTTLAWVGVLRGGDRTMLADEAAGYLWGIVREAPGLITAVVPNDRHPEQHWPWRYRRARQLPRALGSPPRTPLPDTVVDLCVLQPQRQAQLLADVVSTGRSTTSAILKVLDARPRVPGRKNMEAMLGRVREGIHSELEYRYARDVERAHGLPRGQRQFYDGRYRTDVRYDRLIVELDGRVGHIGAGAFRDMRRDNDHLLRGELSLRYGWHDVTVLHCEVASQVDEMLRRLGWPGTMHPCPSCRFTATDHVA